MVRFLAAVGLLLLTSIGAVAQPVYFGGVSDTGTGCNPLGGTNGNVLVFNTAAGCTFDATSSLSAGALTLGASGTLGSVTLGNVTSGTLTLQPVTGALTGTVLIPSGSQTLAGLNTTQTFLQPQTFLSGDLLLLGSSTGVTTFASANASATNYTATLPANTGTVAELNLAQTFTAAPTFGAGATLPNAQVLTFLDTSGDTTNWIGSTAGNIFELNLAGAGGGARVVFQANMKDATNTFQFNTPVKLINTMLISEASAPTTTFTPVFQSNLTSISGSVTSGSANYFSFTMAADTLNTTGGSGPGGANVVGINGGFGGAAMTGNRNGFSSVLTLLATTGNAASAHAFYTAGAATFTSAINDNGTGGTPAGNGFGFNSVAQLQSGATFFNDLVSHEADISAATGSSVAFKQGIKVVMLSTDAVQGSLSDYAIGIAGQAAGSSPGFKFGLQFGSEDGWWATSGTLIGIAGSFQSGGPARNAVCGICFSAVTFSSFFLQSTGFSVNGSGNLTAASYTSAGGVTLSGLTTGTQVSCLGLSSGNAVVTVAGACGSGNVQAYSCAVPLTTGVGASTLTCFMKASRAFTVDNITATVAGTLVTVTPSVFECGTSTTCASPTTIGSGAVTSSNTATPITVASAAITSGDYIAVELTAGTVTSVAVNVQVEMH
jgi:hypothetical protein